MTTAYLLDAYALIYRAYYAFLRSPRVNSKGVNTSAIFGFVNSVVDLLTKRKPDYIAVAFDVHEPTFRHVMYPLYKAQREAQPEDIRVAVPYIKQFLRAMNITIVECPGYEADDVIGTLSLKLKDKVDKVFMMTPDKDYAQLVRENVVMYRPSASGGIEEWGLGEIKEHFGVERADQIIDLLGLWGDSSDNIPGCPGVGEKRAKELLMQFGSIDGIYEHLDELKGKLKDNFVNNKEQVMLSRKLATIVTDAPVEFDIESCRYCEPDMSQLKTLFDELEFRNVLQRVSSLFAPQQSDLGGLFAQMSDRDDPVNEPAPTLNTYKTVAHEYIVAETDEELRSLASELRNAKLICFDTETTSVEAMQADIVGLSFSVEAHKAYYIPFHISEGVGLFAVDYYSEAKRRLEFFKDIFESDTIAKVGQNMKYDILVLSYYGIEVRGTLYDTMIAHALLYPGQRHNMDDMSATLLHYQPIEIEELIGKGAQQKNMKDVPIEHIKEYAAEDADVTLQLWQVLEERLKQNPTIEKLFSDIEMPLMPVLADMERTGVTLDIKALKKFSEHLKEQISNSENTIYDLAGEKFNISSPKQVGEVLFEKLKIDAAAKKTKTGQYSTSEETLQKLAHDHPIAAEILNYRGLLKLLNTYSDSLPKLINQRTGRIHTSFNQTVVITGRLSSTNPNLQNIPIRDENGKEIRKAFVASDSEHVILAADYSQVELRLMAHFSNDEHLIEAFKRGDDIHAATAAKVFKVPIEEVTKDMRRKAKTANFGIIYGISAFGLAERLDIPRKEAKEIIDGYFDSFKGVKTYMERCVEDAKTKGAVETLFGRRRELDDINSKNSVVRGVAERNAINAPIQGTAADIIKIAMVNIFDELNKRHLKTKMILQVHDELVFDTPRGEIEVVEAIVKDKMENACQLSVPLVAEVGIGDDWLAAH